MLGDVSISDFEDTCDTVCTMTEQAKEKKTTKPKRIQPLIQMQDKAKQQASKLRLKVQAYSELPIKLARIFQSSRFRYTVRVRTWRSQLISFLLQILTGTLRG